MPSLFDTMIKAHPSYTEPELIITNVQASNFMDVFAGKGPRVRLSDIAKYVYAHRIDIRTQTAAQQASQQLLPGATITGDFIQTTAYLLQSRQEYGDIEVAEAAAWNVGLPEAYRLGAQQGIWQAMRLAALYGINPANNEGLIHSPGATTVNLPPDYLGNQTLVTYDNGALALFFLGLISEILNGMYQGSPQRLEILGPQRVIRQMELVNVVQLTNYARPGAGTATTAQEIEQICEEFGYEVGWGFDDTLIGQGAEGADLVLLVVPEITVPATAGINTNPFAQLSPNLAANTMIYSDMIAPLEVTTPIPQGLDVRSTLRITSGWNVRPEALYLVSIPYS